MSRRRLEGNGILRAVVILLATGVLCLAAAGISLRRGRTIGLYGVLESRGSVFYWILVGTYTLLGVLSLFFALRLFRR